MMSKRSFGIGLQPIPLSLALFCSAIATGGAHGQSQATVLIEENLRAQPQGVVLGRLLVGSTLPVLRVQGRWVEVDLQGWIWTRSIQTTERPGFDLTVSLSPHENLRVEPSGAILARLAEGALLERLEDVAGWTRVRRVAWVWGPSLDVAESESMPSAPAPTGARPAALDPGGEPGGEGWWRGGPGPTPILTGPDGDTLALALPGAELQVLARRGNWVRVRLEGWAWAPNGDQTESASPGVLVDVTPDEVTQSPDLYRGQMVDWELQFISQEEAERVRTDFYEGEPFLLTRSTEPGRAFVYVAVPPERLVEVEGLIPLERIRVVGRIRTGAAALTGNPILDLLELTRVPRN